MSGPLLDFGAALQCLKQGERVSRLGWNGKGLWLILVPADQWSTSVGPNPHALGGMGHRRPWVALKTVDNGLVPWVASQTDLLAEDWLVERE